MLPGKWTLWRCSDCGSAYLNPRPSAGSIERAYWTYYAHREASATKTQTHYNSLDLVRKFRRRLMNGYSNWRFGTRREPELRVGVLVLWFARTFRMRLGRAYRHLPRLPHGGGTVLDVGCGDGSFLEEAASLGWSALGVDPDPKAVANCRGRGLQVFQGGVGLFDGEQALFDVITLNHVIEHVHDPLTLLKACHRLLKPTGQLWLETPNIDSLGHRQYGSNWRGLEPPRHLILFNNRSLTKALHATGFVRVQSKASPSALRWTTKVSEAIKRGLPLEGDTQLTFKQNIILMINIFLQATSLSPKEFLTVAAFKE